MKALPEILKVGPFETCNLLMCVVEYATPLSYRQRNALKKRVKRFCVKHCKSGNRIHLEFDGAKMQIHQYAASCDKPFTKFHFSMLLNLKLGGQAASKRTPQESPEAQQTDATLTVVSVA